MFTVGTKNGVSHPNVYQQDDYYPFGLEILRTSPVPNPKNEYLYNKKELQEEFTEYDYGARFYDPVIGRWTTVDPHGEKYNYESPFNYGGDNPIANIDVGGKFKYPAGKAGERQAREFKKFTKYLHKGGIDQLLKSKALEAAYAKYAKLSPDQLKKDFTWGSGPTIKIVDNPGGVENGSGHTDDPMTISISADIVRRFENASSQDEQAALLGAVLEVLHEETHSGDDHSSDPTPYGDPDPGTELVKEVYGTVWEVIQGQLSPIYVPFQSIEDMENIIKEKDKSEEGRKLIPVFPDDKKPDTRPDHGKPGWRPKDDKDQPIN